MTVPSLAVRDLSVQLGEHPALRGLTFSIAPGSLVALTGPNGSGKSTLIRSLVGLEERCHGEIDLRGRSTGTLTSSARAREVAWMPQEEPAGDDLEVEEYVGYGRHPYRGGLLPVGDPDPGAVERALQETETTAFRRRRVHSLSGGERQRVRLARILAQEAPVVLLDEPTSHLDMGHQLDLLERVRALAHRPGRAVVIALHDLNLASRYADRVLVLSHGALVADGDADEVLSPALLRDVWGVDAELRRGERDRRPYLIPRLPITSPARVTGARPRVHVVAGGGSGQAVLRRLFDEGYPLSAGVLPLFDSDSDLAEELGLRCVREVPFAPISDEGRAALRGALLDADAVVLAAFPVGPTNLANLEEVLRVAPERPVLLLRQPPDRTWDFSGGRATAIRARILELGGQEVPGVADLLAGLSAAGARPAPGSPAL